MSKKTLLLILLFIFISISSVVSALPANPLIAVNCTPNPTTTNVLVSCKGYENAVLGTDINYTLWSGNILLNSTINNNVIYNHAWNYGIGHIIKFNSSAGANYTANNTGLTTILDVHAATPNNLLFIFMGLFVLIVSTIIVMHTYKTIIESKDTKKIILSIFLAIFVVVILIGVLTLIT
jgi:hypothetical protein